MRLNQVSSRPLSLVWPVPLVKLSHPNGCRKFRRYSTSLTTPAATLTSVLTMGIGNTVMGTVSNNVLWSLALVLLLMSLGFNMLVKFITVREREIMNAKN